MAKNTEKLKNLKKVIDGLDKDFGKGTVMILDEKPTFEGSIIPSGSLTLDRAMGIGGYPKGRIIEIYGPESSGKTTLAMHAIANSQAQGGVCAYIDVEHAFDSEYARSLNIDTEELFFSQPDNAEQALTVAKRLIESNAVDVVVIDSVAALVPKNELEGNPGDQKLGSQARLMGQALRMLAGMTSKSNCLVIFINQIREKIGVMFGSPETTSGGNALKFYASIRLDIRRASVIKEGEESVANEVRVKVVKNKLAPPFKTALFRIIYGTGIDSIGEVLELAVEYNIVEKSGSWYAYNKAKLGQGSANVRTLLADNQELYQEIKEKVISLLNV